MTNTIRIKVDETLKEVLERVRREVAENMKKVYNLQEVTIYGTLASQIAAARLNGKSNFSFRIRKTGLNCGILELV